LDRFDTVTEDRVGVQEAVRLLGGSEGMTVAHPAQWSQGSGAVLEVRHFLKLGRLDGGLVGEENVWVDTFLLLKSEN
jgi:hypothetical protein